MTRLRNALDELAEQSPPLGDIADRALERSRRRRLRLGVPVACAAAAACVLVLASLVPFGSNDGTEDDSAGQPYAEIDSVQTIRFPDEAEPLPDKDVGPALLTYAMACDGASSEEQCQWRVMTADGTHWTLPEADFPKSPPEQPMDAGLVTVSPDGKRIGYLREDGAFMLRDLSDGTVDKAFSWQPETLNDWNVVWSSNSRWLTVSYESLTSTEESRGESALLDTATMDTTDLPVPKGLWVYGVRDNGEPLYEDDVPDELLKSVDGALGALSPDGTTLAALTFPGWERPVRLSTVDLDAMRVEDEVTVEGSLGWDAPEFLGWSDSSTALLVAGKYPSPTQENNVYAFDVRSGKLERILHLPDTPRGVSLATRLVDVE